MIACCPNVIKAGSQTDHVSAFWDVMPTIAEIADIQAPKNLDGISFLPSLSGKGKQVQHESLYWEFHEQKGRQALRKGDWKLIRYNVLTPNNTTTELYNLKTDLGEEKNVADQNPKVVKEMMEILNRSRIPSEVFPFGEHQ